ncbi:MAG TPA: zinc-binding dehydrogenase [Acidimicrobiales bacterium]
MSDSHNSIEAGQLTPSIERTYPLHEVPDAMRHLVAGHTEGNLAISTTDVA